MEPAKFMGDTVLRLWIGRLEKAKIPLLTAEPYRLTEAGREVLGGKSNFAELNGIDRWMGGFHIRVLDAEARLAKMRADWDSRAQENARYYVATGNSEWTDGGVLPPRRADRRRRDPDRHEEHLPGPRARSRCG